MMTRRPPNSAKAGNRRRQARDGFSSELVANAGRGRANGYAVMRNRRSAPFLNAAGVALRATIPRTLRSWERASVPNQRFRLARGDIRRSRFRPRRAPLEAKSKTALADSV